MVIKIQLGLFSLALSSASLLLSTESAAAPRAAKVYPVFPATLNRVIDGDTVVLTINGVSTHTRLCGIDASEAKTPMGPPATAMLRSLLEGRTLSVAVVGKDLYQRTVGSIYIQSTAGQKVSVQAAMAKAGLAYYYSVGTCPDRQEVIDADNYAKAAGLGMRAIPGYPAPWETRMRKSRLVPAVPPLPLLSSDTY
jgi:endonuclease YncB( thermonuclease family)